MQYWQKEELQAELEELMDRARELDAPTSTNDKIEEVNYQIVRIINEDVEYTLVYVVVMDIHSQT